MYYYSRLIIENCGKTHVAVIIVSNYNFIHLSWSVGVKGGSFSSRIPYVNKTNCKIKEVIRITLSLLVEDVYNPEISFDFPLGKLPVADKIIMQFRKTEYY